MKHATLVDIADIVSNGKAGWLRQEQRHDQHAVEWHFDNGKGDFFQAKIGEGRGRTIRLSFRMRKEERQLWGEWRMLAEVDTFLSPMIIAKLVRSSVLLVLTRLENDDMREDA